MREQVIDGTVSPCQKRLKSKKVPVSERCKQILQFNQNRKNKILEKQQVPRQVIIDTSLLPNLPENNQLFISNKIATTKYNWFNFFPKSLIVQFKRVSNCYFLGTVILMCIPGFSPIPAYSSIGPLSFVLLMSMAREGYEDYKRMRNDTHTNDQKCKVLRNKQQDINQVEEFAKNEQNDIQDYKEMFSTIKWQDIKCGDILYIEDGEHFPADVILLTSSAQNGECFVQTSTLDGERALKHKQCLVPIQTAISTYGLQNLKTIIHGEPPSKSLYTFSGYIESEQFPENNTIKLSPESSIRTISLDHKQMALRGSNLANTSWAIASVIYTGTQSKLMMNQGQYRHKQSKIEKLVNTIVIYLIIIQAVLCIIMSILEGFFTANYASLDASQQQTKAEYIFYTPAVQGNATINDLDAYTPTAEGFRTYAQYYILLNTLVPISLIVTLEFVKLIQTPFMQHDVLMFDEESMKQCTPVSLTLHEELGFVNYVFADKTGTLTSNVMQFMGCTIGSVCYDVDYKEDDYEYEIDICTPRLTDYQLQNNAICPSITEEEHVKQMEEIIQESIIGQEKLDQFEKLKEEHSSLYNRQGESIKINKQNFITDIVWNYQQATNILKELLQERKYFNNEETNLGSSVINGTPLILKKQNDYLSYFWLNIALCHDVIVTKQKKTGLLGYQGTSPDEITLLDAAKEVGFIFKDRSAETITVEVFGKLKVFQILQKIEFTSDRKKMSVVIEDPVSGLLILYCKGADFAIFERLSVEIEQHFLEATKEDLIKFSTQGFRTLCFGMRVLDKDYYYNDWLLRFESAKLEKIKLGMIKEKEDDKNMIECLQNELENQLFLIGATALEDKLQDGVPDVIEEFHQAGIKVWMLTGDKLETAENIGFSSKMFNEKMYIFKLQTKDIISTKKRLQQIDDKINEIQGIHEMPIIGTQFILNPNANSDYAFGNYNRTSIQTLFLQRASQLQRAHSQEQHEAKNIIKALEEYRHESRASEYTLNDSWAKKPVFRRKTRKRIEEIVPDKAQIVDNLVRDNQFFKASNDGLQYIPQTFDMRAKQYFIRRNNIYRSNASIQGKNSSQVSNSENEDSFGVIIEGQTLSYILESETMKLNLLDILAKCNAVIVCRASPSQKAIVVQMVKDNEPEAVTLAIGDGANDVNMIQKAHVGIGIFGKEGYQAASCSDYAIGQFKFLRRLMFVHGRWNAVRLSNFILFFFHKNIVFTLPQFWYGWYSGFSGQTFWDSAYITMFNTLVTAFAVMVYAVWEQDLTFINPKQAQVIEMFFPYIYKSTQGELFTKKKFCIWFCVALFQSVVCFGLPSLCYQSHIDSQGRNIDLWSVSLCSYFSIVTLHYLMLIIFTKNWTAWKIIMYIGSYLLFFPFFIFAYNELPGTPFSERLNEMIFNGGFFWLLILATVFITIIPVYFYFNVQCLMFPDIKDLIQSDQIDFKQIMKEACPKKQKAAHDLFKQKQQQQLQQWEDEYKNFDQKSPVGKLDNLQIIQENDQKYSKNQGSIPRKGLQGSKQQINESAIPLSPREDISYQTDRDRYTNYNGDDASENLNDLSMNNEEYCTTIQLDRLQVYNNPQIPQPITCQVKVEKLTQAKKPS